MKVINAFKVFGVLGWLFLSFNNCDLVYADNNNVDCHDNKTTVCNNIGNIYNYYYSESIATQTGDSTTSNDETVGNLQFKMLGCIAKQDKVKCDIQVLNSTSLDRTLYVSSRHLGGIGSLALSQMGITTMIDNHGASYIAQAVRFANQSGNETGQSSFTVYSNTPTKLTVFFAGVDNPATVKRLDLLVGENTSSGILYDNIKYTVRPKVKR